VVVATMEKTRTTQFDSACEAFLVQARDYCCRDSLNELACRLEPVAREAALSIIRGTDKFDFADESATILFAPYEVRKKNSEIQERPPRIFSFDSQGGSFEAWCRTVLHRVYISRQRKRSFTVNVEFLPDKAVEENFDFFQLHCQFDEDDLEVIFTWTAAERLMLLCLSGLFVKVPKPDWQRVIIEAEEELGRKFPKPFPIVPLLNRNDPSERIAFFAELIGTKTNTLSTRWMRKKRCLTDLSILRDLALANQTDTRQQ